MQPRHATSLAASGWASEAAMAGAGVPPRVDERQRIKAPSPLCSEMTPLNLSILEDALVTCYLRYVVDPYKLDDFETYARLWIPLVARMGGTHHGYFLPHEGANNIAVALFSFPSLAAYESYRARMAEDPECQEAYTFAERTRCILSYERSFMRPVLT
jgi:hypothetical protein